MISFADVEQGRFDRAAVRGKIVVVGATAERANDSATSTSGGGLMPGPEVEAAAISTALARLPAARAPPWLDTLLALLLAVVAPLAALRFRVLVAFGAGVGAVAIYLLAAQLAFNGDRILAIVPALAGALVGLAGAVVVSRPQESPGITRLLDRLTPKRRQPAHAPDPRAAAARRGVRRSSR